MNNTTKGCITSPKSLNYTGYTFTLLQLQVSIRHYICMSPDILKGEDSNYELITISVGSNNRKD